MKIFSIIISVLSAFCGIQSKKNSKKDEEFIEKNGIKYFLIVGFFLVIILGYFLYYIINIIL